MARDLLWGLMARESECKLCGRRAKDISGFLGICGDCAKEGTEEALRIALDAHARSRARFGLPPRPPKNPSGLRCGWCGNDCRIGEGERGFCGLVENMEGRLIRIAGTPEVGIASAYLDPHPTNCVAAWACAGGSGAGYPKYSLARGPEYGFYNLAVFYGACSYDCLYCQNWHFRGMISKGERMSSEELASMASPRVTCICFFGGDPIPQIHHAIEAARIARRRRDGILRVCLETNGNMAQSWLDEIARISWESGGGIKFDLKCYNESLHIALTGVSNRQALENIRRLSKLHGDRPEVPFIRASTLLVPGYVDEEEVKAIAEYLASIDPTIPYSLLAYSPQFEMDDLPLTSARLAEACKRAAEEAGLERVNIGNRFLLAH
ncbi:MAG: radical SAM protein [Candidatus Bathyarchaeia archaeon]